MRRDGRLAYGSERIIEAYYTAHLFLAAYLPLDMQAIARPGYNRDRGPVALFASRLHIDF